jgi:hypothetical protein
VQTASRDLNPEQREQLRGHIVNLRQGHLSSDGDFITTEEDVRRIFHEHLPAALAEAHTAGRKLRVLFYAHGGLVDEAGGLGGALQQLPFWRANGIYPVFFIWETGLLDVLADLLRKALIGTRGLGDFPKLALAKLLEGVARPGGVRVWGNMKLSAKAASDAGGGARLVASLAADFVRQHANDCEVHTCGHSAGAIFHAFFVPVLVNEGVQVKSLHFLAPAVNIPTFSSHLMGLAGHGLEHLTMFTMKREFELVDTAGPYPKSLLYLVHHAFEDPDETPVLGLEENVRADANVLNFFRSPVAEIVFSVTNPGASKRSATEARHHGDFDNDAPTMNSVCRRILDVSDATAITDFPQARTRDFDPLEKLAQEIVATSPAADGPSRSVRPRDAGVGLGRANFTRQPHSAAPSIISGGPPVARRGQRIALSVGIDSYPAPNTLHGCVNDSQQWEGLFADLGYAVTSLRNGDATRSAITQGLADKVRALRAGDVLIFQYAGHGTQFDDDSGDESDGKDEVLCPVDMMTAGFIRDDEMRQILNSIPSGALVVSFLDCCHSETMTRMLRELDAEDMRIRLARAIPPTAEMIDLHRRTRSRGRAVAPSGQRRDISFTACRAEQVAFETDGHGDYTSTVVPLLRQATAGVSNLLIQERIRDAFGTNPRQNPRLDCESSAEGRPFLEP